jgi:hypothetical protein
MPRSSIAIAAIALVAATAAGACAADLKPIIVAEPIHSIGYLPLYIAVDKASTPRLSRLKAAAATPTRC